MLLKVKSEDRRKIKCLMFSGIFSLNCYWPNGKDTFLTYNKHILICKVVEKGNRDTKLTNGESNLITGNHDQLLDVTMLKVRGKRGKGCSRIDLKVAQCMENSIIPSVYYFGIF